MIKKTNLVVIVLLSSFFSYSQTNSCSCSKCRIPTKVSKHKKTSYTKTVTPSNGYTINIPVNVSQIVNDSKEKDTVPTKTKIVYVEKKIYIKDTTVVNTIPTEIIPPKPIVLKTEETSPEYEIYGGLVRPKAADMALGYALGANIITKIYRDTPLKTQPIFTKLLFGMELSQYEKKPQDIIIVNTTSNVVSPSEPCDGCETTTIGNNGSSTMVYNNIKHSVTGYSLNFGVGLYNGIFLLTGITDYKHTYTLNNESIGTYNKVFIDFGVKKFFKVGRAFIAPTFKLNQETMTFALGFSY